jgi:hypothetical protein
MSITGNIYCITCLTTGDKYIGSTSKHIEVRLEQHKSAQNHCSSRKIIDRKNFEISLLETVLSNKKQEVLQTERRWIETHRAVAVNKNLPCQTPEEKKAYILAYEHSHSDYYKAYRLAHRDKWQSRVACGCGATVNRINMGTHLKSAKHEKLSHARICT